MLLLYFNPQVGEWGGYTTPGLNCHPSFKKYMFLFFSWLFIASFTAKSCRDVIFFVWEWYFVDTLNLNRHICDFFLFMVTSTGRGSQVVFSPCVTAVNNHVSGNAISEPPRKRFPHSWQTSTGPWPSSSLQAPCTVVKKHELQSGADLEISTGGPDRLPHGDISEFRSY